VSDNSVTESQIMENFVDLTKYVPNYISNDPITSKILYSQGYNIGMLNYYINDIIANCFISTSTWGLDIFELEYGITTDYSKSYNERRSVLLAKRRGFGVINEAKIKSIADAYNCDCEVIPHWDEYYFIIKFTGLGVPSNLDAFKAVIEQIKPAHLGVEYEFTYELWSEVNNGFTWQDVLNNNNTWNDILNKPLRTSDQIMYTLNEDGITYSEIKYEIDN
jgi:hypothetical protein